MIAIRCPRPVTVLVMTGTFVTLGRQAHSQAVYEPLEPGSFQNSAVQAIAQVSCFDGVNTTGIDDRGRTDFWMNHQFIGFGSYSHSGSASACASATSQASCLLSPFEIRATGQAFAAGGSQTGDPDNPSSSAAAVAYGSFEFHFRVPTSIEVSIQGTASGSGAALLSALDGTTPLFQFENSSVNQALLLEAGDYLLISGATGVSFPDFSVGPGFCSVSLRFGCQQIFPEVWLQTRPPYSGKCYATHQIPEGQDPRPPCSLGTMDQYACALFALTSALNSVFPDSPTPFEPLGFNDFLVDNGGFVRKQDATGEFTIPTRILDWDGALKAVDPDGTLIRRVIPRSPLHVAEFVCSKGLPLIARVPSPHPNEHGVYGDHFVLITGRVGDDYTIADTATFDGQPPRSLLSQYGGLNAVRQLQGIEPTGGSESQLAFTNNGLLEVLAPDSVEILVTDPLGRSTGTTEPVVEGIPDSLFDNVRLSDDTDAQAETVDWQAVSVYSPEIGLYSLRVSAEPGIHTIHVRSFAFDGQSLPPVDIEYIASAGSTSIAITFSGLPEAPTLVRRNASLASLADAVTTAWQLGAISSSGVYVALTQRLARAASLLNMGNTTAATRALEVFASLVTMLSGHQIEEDWAHVLSSMAGAVPDGW